jgi:exocyst complex component 6
MPMAINTMEEYEKVVNVSWFSQDKTPDEMRYGLRPENDETHAHLLVTSFPCVLPFSQMYPLCCIDIRNFLNQFYFFSDDHFQHPNVIDETLRKVGCASEYIGFTPSFTNADLCASLSTSSLPKKFASHLLRG